MVERLNEWGWKPTEKTDTGKSFKVSETNLATLPEAAPAAAKALVERTMLESRVRTLTTWLENYNENTGNVHGQFHSIGTWTHRMAHREPNLGNVAAEKSIKYHTKRLRELATDLGGKCRSLWRVSDGHYLVGCDAESIQLRVFAHYINDPAFTKALLSGKKEDGTDPHSLNARILRCSRDSAKTFIYAFLLGAGAAKLGEILGVGRGEGEKRKADFIRAYPGLERLRAERIPQDAARGYFEGFDGRLVACNSEHLMLAGYLQNGEACIMKHSVVHALQEIKRVGIKARICNIVHDEALYIVDGTEEEARATGKIQAEAIKLVGEKFNLRCPMSGDSRVGRTWLDVH
jgi:DNA polymerase-1